LIERLVHMGTEQVSHSTDIARLDAILADVADEDAFRRIAEETAKGALQEVWQKMQAVWFRSETVQERLSALASLVLKLALPASICQQLLASSAVTSLKNFDDGFGDRAAQAVIEIEKATATEEVMGHVKHKANSTKIKEQATVNQAQTREIEKLSKQLALALSQLQQLDSQFKSMEQTTKNPESTLPLPSTSRPRASPRATPPRGVIPSGQSSALDLCPTISPTIKANQSVSLAASNHSTQSGGSLLPAPLLRVPTPPDLPRQQSHKELSTNIINDASPRTTAP